MSLVLLNLSWLLESWKMYVALTSVVAHLGDEE